MRKPRISLLSQIFGAQSANETHCWDQGNYHLIQAQTARDALVLG